MTPDTPTVDCIRAGVTELTPDQTIFDAGSIRF